MRKKDTMKKVILMLGVLCMFGSIGTVQAESDAGVKGAEGGACRLYLWADNGDDAADKTHIEMQADGDLIINVGGADVLELDGSGNLAVIGTVTGVGASSVSNLTVSGTLAVTGVGTFTAESVHNLGVDADYITTDADAGIDAKTAGALLVGASTATSVEIGDAGVTTDIQGPLTVLGTTGTGIDAVGATALYIGEENATSVVLGATDAPVSIPGVVTMVLAPKFTATTAVGTATALMTNAPAITEEDPVWITVTIGASDYVMPAWLKD